MMERIFNDENEPFWAEREAAGARGDRAGALPRLHHRAVPGHGQKHLTRRRGARLELTGGHPYATQELCYFSWAVTDDGGAAGEEQVAAGLAGVLRSEHAHFSPLGELLGRAASRPRSPCSRARATVHRGLPEKAQPADRDPSAEGARGPDETRARGQEPRRCHAIVEPFFAQWIVRNLDELPG